MPDYEQFYKARGLITEILEKDFIGPVKENECLVELPLHYYIMGILYPQKNTAEVLDLARNPILENDVETYDASISLGNQNNPSSMGITTAIKAGVNAVEVSGSYAFYKLVTPEEAEKEGVDTDQWDKLDKLPEELWIRKEFNYSERITFSDKRVEIIELQENIQLHVYTHKIWSDGVRVITVVLVNNNQSQSDVIETSKRSAFQPVIHIRGTDNASVFTNIIMESSLTNDPEMLELEMLYSDARCYAQGHGCSVIWDMKNESPAWVETSFFPEYNLLQMKAAEISISDVFSMHFLAAAPVTEVIEKLNIFADEYQNWINKLEDEKGAVKPYLQDTAENNIRKCQDACDRIKYSIALLDTEKPAGNVAFRAFQLANEAMLLQRRRTVLRNTKDDSAFDEKKVTWYPFQLAFILQELASFIEPEGHEGQLIPDRKLVDLLWFPTGGGKTEAYLGITAFVIFLRRLRNPANDGVTAIMRYTLRLLTLQQFERASILIFACEIIRKKYSLGGNEIAIGLWVGGALTPNNLMEARASINKQKHDIFDEKSNPVQIKVCPWCGEELSANDYSVNLASKRMIIRCPNRECDFHNTENGLPVHIIDEAIYEHLPSFIVATVDKFAQLPLNDKTGLLLGINSGKMPPELIIQDELHLISGPLGTMTGLYEAAITVLCERNGTGTKVIASTATIRNAAKQIKALYGKQHSQFPPQGISVKDSFFAKESTSVEKPARQYLGVMGTGTTATTTLIRVNAAILFATRYLETLNLPDKVIDNFWTITGYFNSLRELGGASTQLLDDVQSRLDYLAKTKFAGCYPGVDTSGDIYTEELTSRMSNSEITDIIQVKLKREYKKYNHEDVFDYLLSSNMISVGVDVGRLGIMVVAGQPKTNAEYIQATSRVGRENPGLVIMVYNASRSRDRSHYEQFLKYHSALYRYVEATSLTPFSDRARDRGLHALFVALCRYMVKNLLQNDQAVNFRPDTPEIKNIEKIIVDYVNEVDPDELSAVINELQDIEDEWEIQASDKLVYRGFGRVKKLLKGDLENNRFRTMNSMRNVDAMPGIYLLGG